MKKLFISVLLCLLGIVSMAQTKTVSSIESFKFDAREVTVVNNRKRVKEYKVAAKLPDLIRKEITFPEENKGEVYIYKKDKKIVYLPLFEQSYEENLDNEENYIIKVIKDLKEREQADPVFKEDFYAGRIKEISYENGLKIKFDKLDRISGYYFPVKIRVYDVDALISEVVIKNVQVNLPLGKEEFEI